MFAALAEFERDIISSRTKTGLEAAKARGQKGGRPKGLGIREIIYIMYLSNRCFVTIQQQHIRKTFSYLIFILFLIP